MEHHRGPGPWLGADPEALLLLEADVPGPPALGELLGRLEGDAGASGVALSIGLGRRWFKDAVRSPPPAGLRPLRFHGDDRFDRPPAQDAAQVLLAAGGAWDAVVAATPRLRALLREVGARVVAAHLGSRTPGGRDHTGFYDGTSNLQELPQEEWCRSVLIQPEDDPGWQGCSYLVFRKYEEDLTMWSTLKPGVQEQMIGRRKGSGAFLDDSATWRPETWSRTPPTAHVRRAHPRDAGGDPAEAWSERIYRRSIPYQERSGGGVASGVLFLALARDPHRQVERIHNERLLPAEGTKDFFLTSGYVVPRRSVCYLVAPTLEDLGRRLRRGVWD